MDNTIVFFDGVCNFCNASVNFIIKRDSNQYFQFCPLQSDEAERLLLPNNIKPSELQTIILKKNEKFYFKSRAALEIARKLDGLWPLLYVFVIVPPFIRDFFYTLIAKNRYSWFGKSESCMVPSKEVMGRFLI